MVAIPPRRSGRAARLQRVAHRRTRTVPRRPASPIGSRPPSRRRRPPAPVPDAVRQPTVIAPGVLWTRIQQAASTLAALGTLAVIVFTWLSIQQVDDEQALTREGQVTDRYNAAVTNIGADSLEVRLGGIYALQRIMEDSPRDQPSIVNVLSNYIRNHAKKPKQPADASTGEPASDIQAALTALRSREPSHDGTARVDLADADLTGADLRDANLSSADLRDADLFGANLTFADLFGADLTDADLRDANLSSADLRGADLTGANLSGANLFFPRLSGTNLSGTNLHGAGLHGEDLRGADLHGADLRDADLSNVDLTCVALSDAYRSIPGPSKAVTCADLRDADLTGAILTGADLTGADLRDADLSGAPLSDAYLSGTNLHGAGLHGKDLRGADLSDADLTDADLTDANLRDADLSGADLTGADLRGADLTSVDRRDAVGP
ncbi:pentapeptide repeat-containing protein [Streptomyces sp. VN1]|nr:pentapeptide repeat-containing protein [Streptomyces sp. VN1]